MAEKYWSDIKKYCRTEIAYTQIKDVTTMELTEKMIEQNF